MKDARARFLSDALSPARRTRIVDAGANPLGATPYSTPFKNGLCDVWGFEPQKDAYEKLIANKSDNENYLPYAIGSGGPKTLRVCNSVGFTSIFEPSPKLLDLMGRWREGMKVTDTIEFSTHCLDDLEEIPEFDLLKIDIQGGELDAFRGGQAKLNPRSES